MRDVGQWEQEAVAYGESLSLWFNCLYEPVWSPHC